ncbi:MAG: cytochrome c family protein [Pirellulales bacterium]|nr:cytochrome c family protein [Pirellulales bacterium]
MRKNLFPTMVAALGALSLSLFLTAGLAFPKNASAAPLADPPKDAKAKTYVGTTKCASCHLKENLSWKKMKHAKAFDDLPAAYKEDKSCLACHVTGFGEATGFKSAAATPKLASVSCEACHGPGSEHVKIGEAMAKKEKDKSYWTKEVQSEAWKKDDELRKQSMTRIKLPGVAIEAKGMYKGKNLHEKFEEFKNEKGEPSSSTADLCKKCHTSENGKKTHPDYKK